jgi:3-polyprenyl-4-hydroxybenzoate decarboxylase
VSGMLVRMMLPAVQRINLLLYKVAFDSLPVFDLWLSDSSPMMTSFLVYDLPQTEMGYC